MNTLLKWPGGKFRLAKRIGAHFPALDDRDYIEPFFGGGGFWFGFAKEWSCLAYDDERLWLADASPFSTIPHSAARSYPRVLAGSLAKMKDRYNAADRALQEDIFYQARSCWNDPDAAWRSIPDKATDAIFLNRACFNGLVRHNASGKLNSPWGKMPKISLPDLATIERFGALVRHSLFGAYTPQRPSVVYCDPPYVREDVTSFSSYSVAWDDSTSIRLASWIREMLPSGSVAFVSNSDTARTLEIFDGFDVIDRFDVPRAISASASSRRRHGEILLRRSVE